VSPDQEKAVRRLSLRGPPGRCHLGCVTTAANLFALVPGLAGLPPLPQITAPVAPAPQAVPFPDAAPAWAQLEKTLTTLAGPGPGGAAAVTAPSPAPAPAASQSLRLATGTDALLWMLSLLMHRPCARAWLRLSVDGVERRPEPTPPGALVLFARDVD